MSGPSATPTCLFLVVIVESICCQELRAGAFSTLYDFSARSSFANINADGASPSGGLVLWGDTLYGMTQSGGSAGLGTVFAMKTNGTSFITLHTVEATAAWGNIVSMLSGSTLYGMSPFAVFSLNTDGTGFSILHSFTGNETGVSLTSSVNSLFGTTHFGSIFALNTDGTGFSVLHHINSSNGLPTVTVQLLSNALCGTAEYEDSSPYGMVFALNTDGTGFRTLHSFSGAGDGQQPNSPLISSGNTLFGITAGGGSSNGGTLFRVNVDGTGFKVLYNFDSSGSASGLRLSGDTLYGAITYGNTNGYGTIFGVGTDGSGFTNLYAFTGGIDGAHPEIGAIAGSTLYGTTEAEGLNHGNVFAINTDGTGFNVLHSFSATYSYFTNSDGAGPGNRLLVRSNTLYGTTTQGGSAGNGTVFSFEAESGTLRTLHTFAAMSINASGFYTNSDGIQPACELVLSENTLYGATKYGGNWSHGTIFKVNTEGTGFTVLHSLSNDLYSISGLVISGTTLYGTASFGAEGNAGAIFKHDTNGELLQVVHRFTPLNLDPAISFVGIPSYTNSDGGSPLALLVSGDTLYGVTQVGSSSGNGTIFSVKTNGTDFRTLHAFSTNFFGDDDGAYPSSLLLAGTVLYGTAEYSGVAGNGTLFAIHTDGTAFTNLHSFAGPLIFSDSGLRLSNSEGGQPEGLILVGNTLYGSAAEGGMWANGTVFSIGTNGTGFRVLHSFSDYSNSMLWTNSDGADPLGGVVLSGTTLYGATSSGGTSREGTLFSISLESLSRPQLTVTLSDAEMILTWPTSEDGFDYTGFTLQSATNLASPIWTTVSPKPVIVNGQNTVSNAIFGMQCFFRLHE